MHARLERTGGEELAVPGHEAAQAEILRHPSKHSNACKKKFNEMFEWITELYLYKFLCTIA